MMVYFSLIGAAYLSYPDFLLSANGLIIFLHDWSLNFVNFCRSIFDEEKEFLKESCATVGF